MALSSELNKLQDFWFNIFIIVTYSAYILFAIGIFKTQPQYLQQLDYYVKIYVSLFLLWRFNPFRKIEFTDLDRKIAFSSGIFLFTTTAINQLLTSYLNRIKDVLKQTTEKKSILSILSGF